MLISMKNIRKSFLDRKENKIVLSDVSFDIESGEMIAIVGTSGCGKTTLLNILAGITRQDEGQYIFEGTQVSSNQSELCTFRQQNIGIIPQTFLLINQLNAYKNISLPLELRKTKNYNNDIIAIAQQLGISDILKKKTGVLSVGECQRVAIARAFIYNPKLILADEPSSALDAGSKEKLMALFHKHCQCGGTTIIVTHDKDVAYKCDRVLNLDNASVESESNSFKSVGIEPENPLDTNTNGELEDE